MLGEQALDVAMAGHAASPGSTSAGDFANRREFARDNGVAHVRFHNPQAMAERANPIRARSNICGGGIHGGGNLHGNKVAARVHWREGPGPNLSPTFSSKPAQKLPKPTSGGEIESQSLHATRRSIVVNRLVKSFPERPTTAFHPSLNIALQVVQPACPRLAGCAETRSRVIRFAGEQKLLRPATRFRGPPLGYGWPGLEASSPQPRGSLCRHRLYRR